MSVVHQFEEGGTWGKEQLSWTDAGIRETDDGWGEIVEFLELDQELRGSHTGQYLL